MGGKLPVVAITQDLDGVWTLWIDGVLVDREHDPERSPIADIYRWAEGVAWYERRIEVDSWEARPEPDQAVRYVGRRTENA